MKSKANAPVVYIIDLEKYEEVEKQLELKDETLDAAEEDFVNDTIQRNQLMNKSLKGDNSTIMQQILRSVFINYITFGKLEFHSKSYKA